LGALYDQQVVQALRAHSLAYVHGHQVGGTNPSLVEALGAGNAVFAHDNRFNRWVAGAGAWYFSSVEELASLFDAKLDDAASLKALSAAASERFEAQFTWDAILCKYEQLLQSMLPLQWAQQGAKT
jgi:glycosyltransferase involved in cell wall biosynthesis